MALVCCSQTLTPGVSMNVDLTTETAKKRSQARIEETSPVLPKCLAKALNPPVTIKTFFKAAMAKRESIGHEDTSVVRNVTCSENNTCEKDSRRSMGQSSNKSGKTKNESQGSGSKKRSLEEIEDNGDNYCAVISSKPSSNKRTKQGSIFAAFAKKAEPVKAPVVKKPMQCPICSLTFDPQVSNADVNSHIDNCLIE